MLFRSLLFRVPVPREVGAVPVVVLLIWCEAAVAGAERCVEEPPTIDRRLRPPGPLESSEDEVSVERCPCNETYALKVCWTTDLRRSRTMSVPEAKSMS